VACTVPPDIGLNKFLKIGHDGFIPEPGWLSEYRLESWGSIPGRGKIFFSVTSRSALGSKRA
jgi:hypothetical protein